MVNLHANLVKHSFEDHILPMIGEDVTYYPSNDTISDVGYLTTVAYGTAAVINVRISTLTENDHQMFDLGAMDVDDHKLYSKIGDNVAEHGKIIRKNGEEYEVLAKIHAGAVGNVETFYTHIIRRRRNTSDSE